MRATPRRRLAAAATAAAIAALGVQLSTSTPASADQITLDPQAITAEVAALPQALVAAVQRDLKMSPRDYVVAAHTAASGSAIAGRLRGKLGNRYGGLWLAPATHKLTVAVTDSAAATIAAATGATVQVRPVSEAALQTADKSLATWADSLPADKRAGLRSFAPDVTTGKMIVTLADDATGHALGGLLPATGLQQVVQYTPANPIAPYGAVTASPQDGGTPGKFDVHLRAGKGYWSNDGQAAPGWSRCSYAFDAVDDQGKGTYLTAGHCTLAAPHPMKNVFLKDTMGDNATLGAPVGTFENARWDDAEAGGLGLDYATVRITNPAIRPVPEIDDYRGGALRLTGESDPVVGMPACKFGDTTGVTCGTVTNARMQEYVTTEGHGSKPQMLENVFEVSGACTEGGDSGGAITSGGIALGWSTIATFQRDGNKCYPAPDGQFKDWSPVISDVERALGGHTHIVTTTSDADHDGVPDVQELAQDPTQQVDHNGDGVAAFLDPDEPNLRPAPVTAPGPNDRVTDRTPTITGTGKPAAEVTVKLDGTELTAKVDGTGKWSVRATEALGYGQHTVTTTEQLGGATSKASDSTFQVVPPAPTVTSPRDRYAGPEQRPVFAGTAEPGAEVTIDYDGAGSTKVTADDKGNWSKPTTADVPVGAHHFSITQTVHGVASDAAVLTYTVTGPVPSSTQPVPTTPGGGKDHGGLANTGLSEMILPIGLGALVLIGGGTALVMRSRRRVTNR